LYETSESPDPIFDDYVDKFKAFASDANPAAQVNFEKSKKPPTNFKKFVILKLNIKFKGKRFKSDRKMP